MNSRLGLDGCCHGIWSAFDGRQAAARLFRLNAVLIAAVASFQLAGAQEWSQEVVRGSASAIYLSPASVRKIQRALNDAGFDAGPVDGLWGDLTSRSVTAYQRSHGFEPTGTPTLPLVNALGLSTLIPGPSADRKRVQTEDQHWQQEYTRGPGTPLYLSPAQIRTIQKTLAANGYDPGEVDGIWGPATELAASNFQRTRGLEPTGLPTLELIDALRLREMLSQGNAAERSMQWQQEAAAASGAILHAGPATVRRVQLMLAKEGFDPGELSGRWHSETARAAKNFQRTHGLEPTGTLTTELIRLALSFSPTEHRNREN